ncbi:AAA family ATPase [Microcoleus sp. MON2_D5]|uniref:AAA family ATPase n=1 Tax=Microcoleus sp. MON2_D5 TaxID=2818833 RepID=UPI002FD12C4F
MLAIRGYKITSQIYQGLNTVIYRGIKESDGQPAILKILKNEYPNLEEITRLRQEYEISKNLNIEGIVKPLELQELGNRKFILILEDFGGIALSDSEQFKQPQIRDFLAIAIQVASTLAQLHDRCIIHKDIKPQNIIVNLATNQVKITDFGIATRLSKENQSLSHPNLLEGTLAYLSPEQTGRMNRAIDYRTDFYSLGVTFYEMLTGKLPFPTTDALELVYSHIAIQPVPPAKINSQIPQAISEIVMKLMAKTAEERYQSAEGLKFDLEQCLTQLETTGKIDNFQIGQEDLSSQLQIPQKLYGRFEQVQTLLAAFDRISNGTAEMMLVAGYSGIGKTAVVNEVHKPIVRQHGYFIAGKFDQFKRNIPYASLIEALSELMRQLLTESPQQIENWKQKLLNALGQQGRIITEVIPEVELIVGEQPPVPEVGATEAQNRFNRVFASFIQVFTQPEHPLVIFLDDLQWADLSSLKLIQLLVTNPDSQYLLMIGAYRDNEVSPTHPLMQTLKNIQENSANLTTITLAPLSITDVNQIVADTLKESQKSQSLSALLFNKTQGNPFFLNQLLKYLYEEKLLAYNFNSGQWEWEIDEIQAIGIADYNVVELMVKQIQRLPEASQKILQLAACIGSRFYLDVLAIVNEESPVETANQLWSALEAGLILPLNDAYKIPLFFDRELAENLHLDDIASRQTASVQIPYKFLHDRVQQAAYSLIAEDQKKLTHLKIGQLLLKNTTPSQQEENIFAIVNQLNIGSEFITEQSEKNQLAALNLAAGRKAKAATASEAAANYFNAGMELLAASSWPSNYELTLNLYIEAVEAEYLCTNFERAAALAEIALQQATTLLEKVKVYELKVEFYIAQNQLSKALETGLQAVEMLGVSLAPLPSEGSSSVQMSRLEELENLPEMTDPYLLAALRILITATAAASISAPSTFVQIVLTKVNLCVERGHSALAAIAYANYGIILCGPMADLDAGYYCGQLAIKLLDIFPDNKLKCRVYAPFYGLISHWKEQAKESIAPLEEAIQAGLETGDYQYAGYCVLHYCTNLFLSGERLEMVDVKISEYIKFLNKIKQEFPLNFIKVWHQLTLNLQGLSSDKMLLQGKSFDEAAMLVYLQETKNATTLLLVYQAKAFLCYLFKDYSQALACILAAHEHLRGDSGMMTFPAHYFYYSLILLANYNSAAPREQQQYLELVESHQEKMKCWAQDAPMNYQHKYDLIEAEKARILGQNEQAINLYERAISGAIEYERLEDEAIAKELAGEFHFACDREHMSRFYLNESYYAYIRWGATAKAQDLESRYPKIFGRITAQKNLGLDFNTTTLTIGGSLEGLELLSVLKFSKIISGQIVLSELILQFMKIALNNAGAQKGFLILNQSEGFAIAAAGEVEDSDINVLLSPQIELEQVVPLSVIYYVEKTLKTVVLNNAKAEGSFRTDPYIRTHQPKSVLCIPIINQGKMMGLLYFENNLATSAFTPTRLEVLKLISSQAAISLENAFLYHTQEQKVEERTAQLAQANQEISALNNKLKAENIRLSAELEVTKRLQQMILPKQSELDKIKGLEIAGYMQPADEVGGDYYDVLTQNDTVKISIGDVTGHGLESGVLMIMAQTAVRTLQQMNETDPVKFLDVLNRTLYANIERIDSSKNMTLALLDYQDSNFSLSGQHEEVIVVRTDGNIELIDTLELGFPLGLEEDISAFVSQIQVHLNPGDVVVLYTDGITESVNINRVYYGIERLCKAVKENRHKTVEEIRQAVIDDVRQHIDKQKVFDDITLVVLKQK